MAPRSNLWLMVENEVDQKLTSIRGHHRSRVYSRFVEDKRSKPFDVYSAQLVGFEVLNLVVRATSFVGARGTLGSGYSKVT